MNALAVTGIGVASALGIGRNTFVEAMRSGASPAQHAARLGTFDATKYRQACVVDIGDFNAAKYLGDKGLRSLDRLTKLLIVAVRLALHDSGLKKDGAWASSSAERVGVVVSNAYGSLEAITELDRVATLEDPRYINPSRFPLTVSNTAAGYASIWEELRAVNVSVSDGNCGALDAVACASVLLSQARADALVVGGVEALSEALAVAFDRLGALAEGARIGEGAALVTLEACGAAHARGAQVLATIEGYGTAFAPPEREASLVHASSEAVEYAIADALNDAGIEACEVGLVVSGVSGLRAFDDAELEGIDHTIGKGVCVLAPKLVLGETFGAGGGMGMLTALSLLSTPVAVRTAQLDATVPHPWVLRGELPSEPRNVLVTSMGYYGNGSALVLRAPSR